MQDDDDRKAGKYIHLCVNLGKSELGIDKKTYFLHVLSDLSHKDIEVTLEFYIRDRYDLKGYFSCSASQKELTSTNDGVKLKSINSLVASGLLKQTLGNEQKYDLPDYYLTSEMQQFIEIIYSHQDLTPTFINKEQKESLDVLFITSPPPPARDKHITVFKNKFGRSHYTFKAIEKDETPEHKYIAKCYITITRTTNGSNKEKH